MHCHLVVPDLFWPDREARDVYAGLTVPAIEQLVARGRKTTANLAGLQGWLARAFGFPDDASLPAAPYRFDADGGDPRAPIGGATSAPTWLCVDPVHLRVDRDALVLADASVLDIAPDEATAIAQALDAHFDADGLHFEAPVADRWYLRVPAPVDVPMTPIDLARGRALEALFPDGAAGAAWRARINEIQMLLHAHPVNERREATGRPAINSVWPWGAGTWQPLTPGPRARGRWLADLPLPRGLARAASLPAGTLPAAFGAMMTMKGPAEGIVHAVLAGPMQAVARGDRDAWRAAITAIEARWAAPALAALRERRIGMVSLHAPGAAHCLDVETAAGDLRYFWRRARPLESYVAPA